MWDVRVRQLEAFARAACRDPSLRVQGRASRLGAGRRSGTAALGRDDPDPTRPSSSSRVARAHDFWTGEREPAELLRSRELRFIVDLAMRAGSHGSAVARSRRLGRHQPLEPIPRRVAIAAEAPRSTIRRFSSRPGHTVAHALAFLRLRSSTKAATHDDGDTGARMTGARRPSGRRCRKPCSAMRPSRAARGTTLSSRANRRRADRDTPPACRVVVPLATRTLHLAARSFASSSARDVGTTTSRARCSVPARRRHRYAPATGSRGVSQPAPTSGRCGRAGPADGEPVSSAAPRRQHHADLAQHRELAFSPAHRRCHRGDGQTTILPPSLRVGRR